MLFLSSTIYFLLHFLSVIGNLNVKGYNFFRRKAPEEAVVPDEKKRGNAVQTFLTFFYWSVTFTRTKREQNATHTREQQKLNLPKFCLFIFAWRTSSLARSLIWRDSYIWK